MLVESEIEMSAVVHCKKSSYNVYIGRPSKWGNPYKIGADGNRDQVINKYIDYFLAHPTLPHEIFELDNKVLGCWCKPEGCHGDFLIAYLNFCKGLQKSCLLLEMDFNLSIPLKITKSLQEKILDKQPLSR